jgi:beta-glucanase (GH16 family)
MRQRRADDDVSWVCGCDVFTTLWEIEQSDTTVYQTNYFNRNSSIIGQTLSGNEQKHNLGFDAAESFHVYGFKWLSGEATDGSGDRIEWQVDVTKRMVMSGKVASPVPSARYTTQRLLINIWAATPLAHERAGGNPAPSLSTSAQVKWIRFTEADANGLCVLPTSC